MKRTTVTLFILVLILALSVSMAEGFSYRDIVNGRGILYSVGIMENFVKDESNDNPDFPYSGIYSSVKP